MCIGRCLIMDWGEGHRFQRRVGQDMYPDVFYLPYGCRFKMRSDLRCSHLCVGLAMIRCDAWRVVFAGFLQMAVALGRWGRFQF